VPNTIQQIVERLIEAVPPPRAAPPRPQSSWASLKVGDALVSPSSVPIGESGSREPGLWEVTGVSSAGVKLNHVYGTGRIHRELTDRNWKEAGWHKLAKRELKKLEKTDD